MKKLILVLWVGALLAGCGEKTQTSDSEVNESPSPIKVFSLGSPQSVISVKQTQAGPRYYFGTKEIALRDISASLSKFPEKKVLLRPDEGISFSVLQEVWIEVGMGGQVEVAFEVPASSGNRPPEQLTLPFTGMPKRSTFKPMPRISVEIGELGDVYLNGGSLIEDGFDPDMKELTSLLRRERELRDQMIQSGRASREVAELFVNISCHPTTEYRALANVFNACLAAEVNHFYPPNFGPLDMPRQKKQQVVLLKRRQKKPAPRVESTSKTKESSDLTVTKVSRPSTVASTALSSVGLALPKPMQNRCSPKARARSMAAGGGQQQTSDAILKGLNWLKANQDDDGSWGANDKRAGGAFPSDKNAMTGMALLCFLGHCQLQDSPEFGETVRRAIEFLISRPPEDPGIAQGNRGCYSHPIRTFALCEAYAMTKQRKLESFAKKATEAIIKGQHESGGWAYGYRKGPTAHVDLSVTGWNVQALKAATLTGLRLDGLDQAMDKAIAYVKRCQDRTGKFAYKERSSGKASLTGAGVLCLQLWKNAKSEEARKGLEWIVNNQALEWSRVNVYEWYYHAQACFQARGITGGTKYWNAWNENFQEILIKAQDSDGHWPHGASFHGDTDVYRTTMTILMMEVFYRYLPFVVASPTTDPPATAGNPSALEPNGIPASDLPLINASVSHLVVSANLMVFSLGAEKGLLIGKVYTVLKSGEKLARIKITKNTPTSCIAKIIPQFGNPSSLRQGDEVQLQIVQP